MIYGIADDFSGLEKQEYSDHPLDRKIEKYISLAEKCFKNNIRDPDKIFTLMYWSTALRIYNKRRKLIRGLCKTMERWDALEKLLEPHRDDIDKTIRIILAKKLK